MWIDQRGSEILGRPECLRLLAVEARRLGVGRIAVSRVGAPIVQPVNFAVHEGDVLVRLGDGFLIDFVPGRLVALEADGLEAEGPGAGVAWSVLVRGLARLLDDDAATALGVAAPRPLAPVPGHRIIALRPDLVTGRRFPLSVAGAALVG